MSSAIQSDSRVYVAGHSGLAGSAVMRALTELGYCNVVTQTHSQLDLTDQYAVRDFFSASSPEFVVLAAAKVGGILANESQPGEFIHQNLAIQTNVIHESWRVGVKRLIFLGSSCIYPRDCPQPIREEYFLTGPLEPTNEAYAIAKIAGVQMCASYNRQYGTEFLCLMPTNLYGTGDNFDLNSSHVVPALIRKAYEANQQGKNRLVAWGTGTPRREFLYSDDLGDACCNLLARDWKEVAKAFPSDRLPLLNVGTGEDIAIKDLVTVVAEVVGYQGSIAWDSSKPDGTPRKVLDISRITSLGWRPKTKLRSGIARAFHAYIDNIRSARTGT